MSSKTTCPHCGANNEPFSTITGYKTMWGGEQVPLYGIRCAACDESVR